MIEGRPRQSLVLYENPIEITGGMDPNDPFKKSFGGKFLYEKTLVLLDFTINYATSGFLMISAILATISLNHVSLMNSKH